MIPKEIDKTLRDYHWMVREIARLRSILEDAGGPTVRPMDEQSGMPRAKGRVSDPVYIEASRREKLWRRVERLEEKVRFVQEHVEFITEERQRTVLDCILDGMTLVAIALHMGTSESNIRKVKDAIVQTIYTKLEHQSRT